MELRSHKKKKTKKGFAQEPDQNQLAKSWKPDIIETPSSPQHQPSFQMPVCTKYKMRINIYPTPHLIRLHKIMIRILSQASFVFISCLRLSIFYQVCISLTNLHTVAGFLHQLLLKKIFHCFCKPQQPKNWSMVPAKAWTKQEKYKGARSRTIATIRTKNTRGIVMLDTFIKPTSSRQQP
jgi:hypothetical protein